MTTRARVPLLCAALWLLGAAAASKCGRRLESNPEEFAACKDGTTVCYFFRSQDPFIILPEVQDGRRDLLDPLEKPFDCSRYNESSLLGLSIGEDEVDSNKGLGGLVFDVLSTVSKSANVSTLCFFAGPDCSFNELVDYLGNTADPAHPAAGMLLGITGILIFTPHRVDLSDSSTPVKEDIPVSCSQTRLLFAPPPLPAIRPLTDHWHLRNRRLSFNAGLMD